MEHELAQYVLLSFIAQGFWALFFLVACVGIWIGVYKLTQLLARLEAVLDPLAGRGQDVLNSVDHTLTMVRDKAESLLDTGEKMVDNVAARVDTTSSIVEGAVARPAIRISSLVAGINRGLHTWRHFDAHSHRNRADGGSGQDGAAEAVVAAGESR